MNSVKLLDATPDGKVTYELLIGNNFSNLNSRSFGSKPCFFDCSDRVADRERDFALADVMHGGAAGLIFGV